MMKWRREPQPIILPKSRYEEVSQTTVVDYPGLRLSSRCNCGHEIEQDNRFCGGCGVRLQDVIQHSVLR
jgi:NADH pyrophosphatase NudC (nudix superfamily)